VDTRIANSESNISLFLGTFFRLVRISPQSVANETKPRSSEIQQTQRKQHQVWEDCMGAEWNKVIDSMPLRVAMIAIGLALWTLAAVGLLAVA